jgi:SNF2 family DNA or RNA helicase
MYVLHGIWTDGTLHLWAESESAMQRDADLDAPANGDGATATKVAPARSMTGGRRHTFAAPCDEVESLAREVLPPLRNTKHEQISLMLPSAPDRPGLSPRFAHAVGELAAWETVDPVLREYDIPSIALGPAAALDFLAAAEELGPGISFGVGRSIDYWCAAARFARFLITHQRIVPMLYQRPDGALEAGWQPWLVGDRTGEQLGRLVRSMPPIVRSAVDRAQHDPWSVLKGFLQSTVDDVVREALVDDAMHEAIEGRDPQSDGHVAWLRGLLDREREISPPGGDVSDMLRVVRYWIARLDEHGTNAECRLALRLTEPVSPSIEDLKAPDDSIFWTLSFELQLIEDPSVTVEAQEIWTGPADTLIIDGHRIENPHELLLGELGRASRVYKRLEEALEEPSPTSLLLNTREAYQFLREYRPLLAESEFGIIVPDWWNNPAARLGAKLIIESEDEPPGDAGRTETGLGTTPAQLGLRSLVSYSWQIALGDHILTLKEFEELARQGAPLIRSGSQWVEVRPEDMEHAIKFIAENPGGETTVIDAIRLAYASDSKNTGLPVHGMSATGWVGRLFGEQAEPTKMQLLDAPDTFVGELRPYQKKGLSWLAFLDSIGFGACLADDMGLGKTIQLLALLLHERSEYRRRVEAEGANALLPPRPTLLIVPMSVVSNWVREAARFAPDLRVLVHHGVERLSGRALIDAVDEHDMAVTTYALAHRDATDLHSIHWGRVVLDEAQNIKNPGSKQSTSIRGLTSDRRVTLTGTPVENRLQELWSIIDFCNPGYLGKLGEFRRDFAVPIERYRKQDKAVRLRGMIRPFVLRRLKTDPQVIADLPDKIESKEYVQLTTEQADLYERTVEQMLSDVDRATGIRRRGVVLATLIKLKQICNHPAQLFKETAGGTAIDSPALQHGPPPDVLRSCKCIRLCEILDEILAEGDQTLIFTQFRQMGHLLAAMLRHQLDREILFMHGGVSAKKREQMIDRFQSRDGSAPVFVLSLKAGGFGLNLTAANHVVHFDRWWNPAVENQATDRAFRIGQTRTVFVHKFISTGTLEERIDQMLERKMELAENIVGSGEDWLTELSTKELRELLELRPDAVSSDLGEATNI